jgi:SSS family solute:Na+ symporter
VTAPALAFLAVSFLIGIHASRRIGGKVRNFYVAGNIIPAWVITVSLVGQAVDSSGSLGTASAALTGPLWAGLALPAGIGVSLVLIGLFYAEPLHRLRLLTLPDFYYHRYGSTVECLAATLCVVSFIVLLASNLAAIGIVLSAMLGVPPVGAVIAVCAIVTAYTMAGGLFAVTWNDILHVGVIFLGFGAALIWMLATHPPGLLMAAAAPAVAWEPLYDLSQGALRNWASFLALALGDIVALDFMERVFAAKSPRFARRACLVSGGLTLAVGVALAALGAMARVSPPGAGGAQPFLHFIREGLPVGIGMMVFMALVSACISTVDGVLMACTTVITRNILQRQLPHLVPPERLLSVSRLTALPVGALATLVAVIHPDPADLLVLAFDAVFAGCLVPLTLGIYWRRANARAALWAITVPSALRLVMEVVTPDRWTGLDTLVPPVLSLLLFVGITRWSRAGDEATVDAR